MDVDGTDIIRCQCTEGGLVLELFAVIENTHGVVSLVLGVYRGHYIPNRIVLQEAPMEQPSQDRNGYAQVVYRSVEDFPVLLLPGRNFRFLIRLRSLQSRWEACFWFAMKMTPISEIFCYRAMQGPAGRLPESVPGHGIRETKRLPFFSTDHPQILWTKFFMQRLGMEDEYPRNDLQIPGYS